MRETSLAQHQRQRRRALESSSSSEASAAVEKGDVEEYSLAKNIAVVLVTVYGGESIMCMFF